MSSYKDVAKSNMKVQIELNLSLPMYTYMQTPYVYSVYKVTFSKWVR